MLNSIPRKGSVTSCIYSITNTINGKMYIGSTKNFNKRMKQHLTNLRKNIHINPILQKSFNKHGESAFAFTILEEVNQSDLLTLEDKYIELYNTKSTGYNIANAGGGDCISKHPDNAVIRSNMSRIMKRKWERMSDEQRDAHASKYKGTNNHMYGRTHSESTRLLISRILTGNKLSEETKEKMRNSFTKERKANLSAHAHNRTGDKNPFYGKSHTESTKQKISQKALDRGFMPIGNREFTIDDIKYRSLNEAHKHTGISISVIRWRLNSPNKKFEMYKYL